MHPAIDMGFKEVSYGTLPLELIFDDSGGGCVCALRRTIKREVREQRSA